ncbi:VPLPA-CTERM-specific exosortase XrtD [Cognatiyoonia sp. IB215182]|uniref:VPLPA-CTERM-specific exosortase XrtD n=1 Tax=Cognatiyoonia sp. IB215182 TaxID=3097353 RepID=UPI002A111584|nr:VPLPA-CTERM-specific exosortase XrtD [Cognatiyoonia sp. IB215182]MDX8353106.1 VPLPA-CTERM-specific exosortase XrtD [Cognatiyoonia sp. IB215182]
MTARPEPHASWFASGYLHAGVFWLFLATLAALAFFFEGLQTLFTAWQLPEYSHGPLIPLLSLLLFLRQLKTVPVDHGPVTDRGPGIALLIFAAILGLLGKLSQIDQIVAYAIILWVGAVLLILWGWRDGRQFWPPVVHLVYMLPLPGVLYYKVSTYLQMVSSELGVWMLQLINVPVFLEGNIIDLGVYKLHVAEACSGLRYLFPIMSFSYVFAVLFRGTVWHKAILLLAAVPITIVMNSVRIAFAGWLVNYVGLEYLEGFTHFFEGWIIFMICVVLLFLLAWLMLRLGGSGMGMIDALDLDTSGWGSQMARLRFVAPSRALVLSAIILGAGAAAWEARGPAERVTVPREPFVLFPTSLDTWQAGIPQALSPEVQQTLGADDYHSVWFAEPTEAADVGLFVAWYYDQTGGGIHSPEICLPGAGWEIAKLDRIDIAPQVGFDAPYNLNRAVIQKGQTRMLVYYWFEQHGRHTAWDFAAKMYLLWDSLVLGRSDGALVRLTTPILSGESEANAERRLQDMFVETTRVLPRFVPGLDV